MNNSQDILFEIFQGQWQWNNSQTPDSNIELVSYDDEVLPHNVAIIYLNSNDGYTFFEDGAKIESVENRCIIFPGNLKHAGTSCTDSNLRVVLNINYTL